MEVPGLRSKKVCFECLFGESIINPFNSLGIKGFFMAAETFQDS